VFNIENELSEIAATRGIFYSLEHIQEAMNLLGNPQDKLKVIHIAGTNGKGTTADFIAQLLETQGHSVGIYSSPHLISYTERFTINGISIGTKKLEKYFLIIKEKLAEIELTEFEILTCVAFLYFADEKVDCLVLETGLGGRLDATNVVNPILTVITTIANDHASFLGDNIIDIAKEKAGIIKQGVPLVMFEQETEVQLEIDKIALLNSAHLTIVQQKETNYLKNNQSLAIAAVNRLRLDIIAPEKLKSRVKSRLEIVRKNPLVLLDAAHNLEGIRSLIKYLLSKEIKIDNLLYAATDRPELEEILEILSQNCKTLFLCEFSHFRSVKLEKFKYLSQGIDADIQYCSAKEVQELIPNLLKRDESILITGSIYFLGETTPRLRS